MAYIKVTSGTGTWYYQGQTPQSAYAAFQRDTGKSGNLQEIDYNTFASGLQKFGVAPPAPAQQATAPPPAAPVAPPKTAYEIAQEAWNKSYETFKSKATEYDATNPFAFDEKLAEGAARQQFDPYYDQKLSDFLTGVERTRQRSKEDEQTVLAELSADTQSYSGRVKLQLDRAINQSREGFNDVGLFESGSRLRSQGNLETDTGMDLADYLRRQEERKSQVQTGTARTLEDVATQQQLGTRDIGREREADVLRGVGEQRQQTAQEYEFGRRQALEPYLVPLGTNVPEYQKTSYDLLYGR